MLERTNKIHIKNDLSIIYTQKNYSWISSGLKKVKLFHGKHQVRISFKFSTTYSHSVLLCNFCRQHNLLMYMHTVAASSLICVSIRTQQQSPFKESHFTWRPSLKFLQGSYLMQVQLLTHWIEKPNQNKNEPKLFTKRLHFIFEISQIWQQLHHNFFWV